jgi:hypothetical protein
MKGDMNKKSRLMVVVILISYFLFTSGFIFEVSKSKAVDKIDIPWNIGLSGERTGVVAIATQDDMNCIKYLQDNWDGKANIIGDYNARCIVTPFIPVYWDLFMGLRKATYEDISDNCFIFVTSWNTEHKAYIEGVQIGLREAYPLRYFTAPIVFQSGDAKIYRINKQ